MGEVETRKKEKRHKIGGRRKEIQETGELKRKKIGRRENENKQRQRVEKLSNFKALISYAMFVRIILCTVIFVYNDRTQRRL